MSDIKNECPHCGENHTINVCITYREAVDKGRAVIEKKLKLWQHMHQGCPVCRKEVERFSNVALYAADTIATINSRDPQLSYHLPDVNEKVKCKCGWVGVRGACLPHWIFNQAYSSILMMKEKWDDHDS